MDHEIEGTVTNTVTLPDPACPAIDGPSGDTGARSDRDAAGRFTRGNRVSLIVGHTSRRLWAAQDDARRGIEDAVLADAGHTRDDAPRALQLAASGLAQAVLIRDAAYARIVEDAGPLTDRGRARRAYTVWLAASERVSRGLALVGLSRRERPIVGASDLLLGRRPEDQP
jgi:hypothetical protein